VPTWVLMNARCDYAERHIYSRWYRTAREFLAPSGSWPVLMEQVRHELRELAAMPGRWPEVTAP